MHVSDRRRSGAVSINEVRSVLYGTARVLGDVQAVRRGRIAQRIGRRLAGRFTGRLLNRLFR